MARNTDFLHRATFLGIENETLLRKQQLYFNWFWLLGRAGPQAVAVSWSDPAQSNLARPDVYVTVQSFCWLVLTRPGPFGASTTGLFVFIKKRSADLSCTLVSRQYPRSFSFMLTWKAAYKVGFSGVYLVAWLICTNFIVSYQTYSAGSFEPLLNFIFRCICLAPV